MTFLAKTKTPDEWKAITSAISTLVDEATFEASVEGISFRGMDPSHVALIDIYWPNSSFEKYECDSLIKFGVRIDEFSKLIKRSEKRDSIELSINKESMLILKIQNGYKKEYKMRLIESSSSSTPLPKLNFNSKIILSDIQVLSEYITIDCKSENIRFLGRGDSGEADIFLEPKNEGLEELTSSEDSLGTYSIDYLIKITKAISAVGGSVIAEYSSKMPLRLEFTVANLGRIHFYLAPRIQD
ncbi:MAG: proliferating cell nuclear antigen (pcna) [Nitrososphaeraceae archaeon]